MKIFFVINALSFGGAERVASRLTTYWSKEHKISIIQTSFTNEKKYDISDNINYINLCEKKRISRLRLIWLLRKLFKKHKPDIIISFLDTGHFYTSVASIGLKLVHICSERNDPYNSPKSKLLRAMRKFAFNHCSRVVFQTEGAKKYFSHKIQKKGLIIPNPIIKMSKQSRTENFEVKKIIAVGRLEHQKNYSLLIDSFSLFSKNHKEFVLNIYGEGSLRGEIEHQIKAKNMESKIFLKGFVSDIDCALNESLVFVMTSLHEGMPNALLEAIVCGIPCLSTDANPGGPREMLSNFTGSILVNDFKPETINEGLEKILNNYDFYSNAAKQDAIKALDMYSIKTIANMWIQLFIEEMEKKND